MPSPIFILTTTPFAKTAIPLGSLVPDRSTPSTDLKTSDIISEDDYSMELDKNFDSLISDKSETWFKLILSTFLSFVLQAERTTKFHVAADRGHRYLLKQPKTIFKTLLKDEETKKWLEDGYRDKQDTWFVIGIRTFVNAKLYRERRKAVEGSGKAKPPISEHVGDVPGSANLGAEAGHKSLEEVKGETETTGERIYAICYRKVKLSFYNHQIEAKLVPGNVWKSFAATRGDNKEENEYLVADLEDEDDIEGYSLEKAVTEDDEELAFGIPPELQIETEN